MPKKFISIVKVDNKLLVLGVSDNSITLLKELESLEKNDKVQVNDDNKTNFLEILKKNLGIR
jgi:flagellar protein FliO/FliZ